MKRLTILATVLLVSFFIATAGSYPTENSKALPDDNPLNVRGSHVVTTITETGVAISFATDAGDREVAELCSRVKRLAKLYTVAEGPAMMDARIIPGTVEFELMPGGGRLLLEPADPKRLPEYRTQVLFYVEHMKKGNFGLMEGMLRRMKERTKGDPVLDGDDDVFRLD
jgi:hypothetical protein